MIFAFKRPATARGTGVPLVGSASAEGLSRTAEVRPLKRTLRKANRGRLFIPRGCSRRPREHAGWITECFVGAEPHVVNAPESNRSALRLVTHRDDCSGGARAFRPH